MNSLVFELRDVGKNRPGEDGFKLRVERLHVARGALLALAGPSGCGKSTILDLLACALRPDVGTSVALPGLPAPEPLFLFRPVSENVTDVLVAWRSGGTDALARQRLRFLGYVLQTGGLLPFLTAGENIFLRCKNLGILSQRREYIQEIAGRLGIARLWGQYPATLSVGERQRVAIAAALAHGPTVVLADEPTAALDPAHAADVMRLFGELARQLGITVIMVTHDPGLASKAGFGLTTVVMASRPDGSVAVINHAAAGA